ncbi:hypothetical protein [Polaribacter glomeratus]|uniref:Uncharacterized protein n=1 Tax=Polaribacter glomeratus TaxID=102 RepID=A0A2S7WFX6_9FLAO|nr:hypothetical protein [Polaribacter glomeratus]PQJ76519.1 hypothetical protein BTO16_11480 [Polaribacter glomeratus]TXD64183.1 hypothetical protein ESX12_15845 [Polaribacter glomeratus]
MFKRITNSSEPNVIGVNNGVYQLEFKGKELKKNINYKEIEETLLIGNIDKFLKDQNGISNLEIKHLKGKLLKKAKLTDIMVFSPFFFGYEYIVSQKFVDCLEEEKVNKNEYHLRKIEIIDVKDNYYLLFVPMIPNTEIVFSESLIYPTFDALSSEKKYFDIKNYEDYIELQEKEPFNSFDKVVLNPKYQERSIIYLQGVTELFLRDSLVEKMLTNDVSSLEVKQKTLLSFSNKDTSLN